MPAKWRNGKSTDSTKHNYNPIDDKSKTGYRRPPKVAGCVLDYFAALGEIEDGGKFAHEEMKALLKSPSQFFRG